MRWQKRNSTFFFNKDETNGGERAFSALFWFCGYLIRSDVARGDDERDNGCGWSVDKVRSPHSYWQTLLFMPFLCLCRCVVSLDLGPTLK